MLDGADESLAGRFELLFCPHWSWKECQKAFGWTLEDWIFYGGYPGSAEYLGNLDRWKTYITHSLIDSVLGRDVLHLANVSKPALLRQLFMIATQMPSQIISYNKMLGQLQDAGNTVTLAHYLTLFNEAFLIAGLPLWSGGLLRVKASSPKIVLWNNALISASSRYTPKDLDARRDVRGRWIENAAGAHLLNYASAGLYRVYYWREGNHEVDFVVEKGSKLFALEIKSGRASASIRGMPLFLKKYPHAQPLVIGEGGIPLEKFFAVPPQDFLF